MRGSVWRRVLVPWMLVGLLVPWTWALLTPIPGEVVQRVGGDGMSFWISKTLHIGVYATLAFLIQALPLSRRPRVVLLVLLVGHGGTTEYLQQFVERHPSWWDVARDAAGVLLGAGLGWLGRWWWANRNLRRVSRQVNLEPDRGEEHRNATDLR
jgi:hypothetical protein